MRSLSHIQTIVCRGVSVDCLQRLAAGGRRPMTRVRAGWIASSAEMAVTVTLPDGNALELPDGATGADAAAAIGPGLARAALAVEVSHPRPARRPQVRDLSRPLPDGAQRLDPHRARAATEALELIRHDAAHVLATAVLELYAGREDLDRPADRGRLLLRLRVPRGHDDLRGRLPARSKSACASTSRPPSRSSARGRARRRGARALPGRSARTTRSS